MTDRKRKRDVLSEHGALNTNPERVRSELFRDHEFFDSNDIVQVKYEMLRQAAQGEPISRTAADFGLSRPSFYKARGDFDREGLTGLVPKKRGPRGAHKLTDEVMDVVEATVRERSLELADVVQVLQERFGLEVHPRSIERALVRRSKKNS